MLIFMQKTNKFLMKKFSAIRWRTKILCLSFVFIVTNILTAGISVFMMAWELKVSQSVLENALLRSNAASKIQIGSAQRSWYQCLLSSSKNSKALSDAAISMIQSTASLEKYIKRLYKISDNGRPDPRVVELKNTLLELRPAQLEIIKLLKFGKSNEAEQKSQEVLQYAYLMEGMAREILDNEQAKIKQNLADMSQASENDTYWVTSIIFMVIIVGVLMSLYLAHLITQPLEELKGGLARVAEGDLKVQFNVSGTGEIAQLARALSETLAALSSAQERLMAQDKMASLGALTAGVAHEIRNPMNFIKNFSETNVELLKDLVIFTQDLMTRHQLLPEDLAPLVEMLSDLGTALDKIQEHTQRIDKIVNGMLQYSGGVTHEEPTQIEVNTLLDQVISIVNNSYKPQDPKHEIKLVRDFEPEGAKIRALPSDLSHALINILNNAFYAVLQKNKAKGRNPYLPQITVKTWCQGQQCFIKVRDNGSGIPADLLKKVFIPFFTTKPTGDGTGLGLSITQDIIINRHRGDIKIQSESGKFTEVTVILPLGHATG